MRMMQGACSALLEAIAHPGGPTQTNRDESGGDREGTARWPSRDGLGQEGMAGAGRRPAGTPSGYAAELMELGGSFRNSMISRSYSLASSTPANPGETLFCFYEIAGPRALPKDRALAPPPCHMRH